MIDENTTAITCLVKGNLALAELQNVPSRPEPRDEGEQEGPDLELLVAVLSFLEARATAQ